MLEVLAIILLIFAAVVVVKILGAILEVGFFVLAVPLKILLGLLGGIIVFIVVPAVLLPLLLVFLLPLLVVGLAVAGLVYLLK